jgi:hypothetical protein
MHFKLHTAALVGGHKVFEGAHLPKNLRTELPVCDSRHKWLCALIKLRAQIKIHTGGLSIAGVISL